MKKVFICIMFAAVGFSPISLFASGKKRKRNENANGTVRVVEKKHLNWDAFKQLPGIGGFHREQMAVMYKRLTEVVYMPISDELTYAIWRVQKDPVDSVKLCLNPTEYTYPEKPYVLSNDFLNNVPKGPFYLMTKRDSQPSPTEVMFSAISKVLNKL